MNQLQVFNDNRFGQLEAIIIDEKPWFSATRTAEMLGYSNPQKAVRDHCSEKGCTIRSVLTNGGEQQVKLINEGNVFRLISKSKLPAAVEFETWVFDEVLPTIRKHGMYATDQLLNNPDLLIAAGQKIKEEQEARRRLEAKIEQDKPLVLFAESIQTSDNSILIGNFAKILKQNGVEIGQNRLFEWLRNNGYLGKSGASRNVPTQRSMDMKLFEITERTVHHPGHDPKVTITTKLTGKGQIYFLNKFMKASA